MMTRTLISMLSALGFGHLLADDWPHYLGPQHDLTWREEGLVENFPKEGLPLVWSAKIGAGYGGPSVADGRLFVMDRVAEGATGRLRFL